MYECWRTPASQALSWTPVTELIAIPGPLVPRQANPTRPPAAASARTQRGPRAGGVRELTRAIARGDTDAFERFYRDWFEPAYAMARTITRRDESFCLDVVQDAMLRVARSIKPMDTHEQLAAWMKRVVHTAALDRLRAERRRLARERAASASDAMPDPIAEMDDRIAWLHEQIVALPQDDRSLLMLRFGRSRTLDATADAHAMTPGAAHGRLRRAIERLRDAANGRGP